LINKIPPNLPFSKGGIKPLFGRRPIGPLSELECSPSRKLTRREKRGKGRFSDESTYYFETVNNKGDTL